MRSIKKWFAGVILAGIVMVGCKKKDEQQQMDPTLTFAADSGVINSDVTVTSFATVRFKVIAQKGADGAKLQTFTFRVTNPGGSKIIDAPRDISGVNQGNSYTFDTTFSMPEDEGTYKCEFIVTDKDNRTATREINVTQDWFPELKEELAKVKKISREVSWQVIRKELFKASIKALVIMLLLFIWWVIFRS